MIRFFQIFFLLFFASTTLLAQSGQRLRIAEWNVENLFDTIPSPTGGDQAFTPQGEMHWGQGRYFGKLGKMARVIAALGGETPAAMVALIEVESDSTMRDLTQRTMLRRLEYDYLITHSPDLRGVNVALLFQPMLFTPVKHASLRVPHVGKERPTRDILHVAGRIPTGDTLDVFVCHWPSRRGGAAKTNPYRLRAAQCIKQCIDSLKGVRRKLLTVVTGDMNSWYPETCFTEGLGATTPAEISFRDNDTLYNKEQLFVLSYGLRGKNDNIRGTYFFANAWNQLDHFMVNGSLLNKESGSPWCTPKDCRIAAFDFLMKEKEKDGRRRWVPNRTYLGPRYQGGYSDHLPLVLDLWY